MDKRLDIIFSRRSIRQYRDKAVDEADIHSLLEAAMAAPSANNIKPWHFITITDKQLLKELADTQPYGKMLADAALGIAVCGNPDISDWWVQDCTAATENILIAAAGLDLGAVWLGVYGRSDRENAIRKLLSIPGEIAVLSLISIGHPAEKKEARTQFDLKRVHRNCW